MKYSKQCTDIPSSSPVRKMPVRLRFDSKDKVSAAQRDTEDIKASPIGVKMRERMVPGYEGIFSKIYQRLDPPTPCGAERGVLTDRPELDGTMKADDCSRKNQDRRSRKRTRVAKAAALNPRKNYCLASCLRSDFNIGLLKIDRELYRYKDHVKVQLVEPRCQIKKRFKLPRKLAMKSQLRSSVSEERRGCLKREAQVHLQMSHHPNVTTQFAAFKEDGKHMIISEYAEGGDLFDLMEQRDNPFSEAFVLDAVYRISKVLSVMHKKKIAHRDVKLENIVIMKKYEEKNGPLPEFKLIDFGSAVTWKGDNSHVSSKPLVGTAGYPPPELYSKNSYCAKAFDMYCVGGVMYRLMVLVPPYDAEDHADYEDEILKTPINYRHVERGWSVKYSIPTVLLLKRLLSVSPEERPSAEETLGIVQTLRKG